LVLVITGKYFRRALVASALFYSSQISIVFADPLNLDFSSEYGDHVVLRVGDTFRLLMRLGAAAYVTLLHQDALGKRSLIVPSQHFPQQYYQAQSWQFFPATDQNFAFTITPPLGQEYFLLVASAEPLDSAPLLKQNLSQSQHTLNKLSKTKAIAFKQILLEIE